VNSLYKSSAKMEHVHSMANNCSQLIDNLSMFTGRSYMLLKLRVIDCH